MTARWESRSGKHWVELVAYESGGYGYRSPGMGGCIGNVTEAEAIASIQSKVDAGYFQPDANVTPMHRVGGAK